MSEKVRVMFQVPLGTKNAHKLVKPVTISIEDYADMRYQAKMGNSYAMLYFVLKNYLGNIELDADSVSMILLSGGSMSAMMIDKGIQDGSIIVKDGKIINNSSRASNFDDDDDHVDDDDDDNDDDDDDDNGDDDDDDNGDDDDDDNGDDDDDDNGDDDDEEDNNRWKEKNNKDKDGRESMVGGFKGLKKIFKSFLKYPIS